MNMKRYYYRLIGLAFTSVLLAACTQQDEPSSESGGQRLTIDFDFTGAGVTVAPSATRAAAVTDMKAGTEFIVRAYTGATLVDDGIYKITTDGSGKLVSEPTDAGNSLSLTRGTYDFYFISYYPPESSTPECPTVKSDNTVEVDNGKDFITTSIQGMKIQSDYDGQVTMTIPMAAYPFSHLCTRVKATLEIPTEQVVAPTAIEKISITMDNLPGNATFTFPGTSFTGYGGRADENKVSLLAWTEKKKITAADASDGFLARYSSADGFVIPLNDKEPLKFNVVMNVYYKNSTSGEVCKNFTQSLELTKALLPGKSYNFVFTLSYYGDYTPADLTLNVQEFTPVVLKPGGAGGDDN